MVPRIQQLRVFGNRMVGSLPPEPFVHVREFDASGNDLEGTIPSSWSEMQRLEQLKLGHNRLCGTIPSTLAMCLGLQRVEFESNRLTGAIPSSLSALTRLTDLRLRDNDLRSLDVTFGDGLQLLEVLDVSGNQHLGGVFPSRAWLLPHMRELQLSNTKLRGEFPLPVRGKENRWSEHDIGIGILCPELALVDDNFTIGVSASFYDYRLCRCKDGDAGRGGESCWKCPYGAVCQNGSSMETAAGYWCNQGRYSAGLQVTQCTLCAPRVCCSRATSCALSEQCSGNRVGVLCGECPRHYSMALGSVSCLPEAGGCVGSSWIVPLVVLGSGLFAGVRTLRFRPAPSSRGLIDQLKTFRASLVFFFQIAPLASAGLSLNNDVVEAISEVVLGVFNLQVADGSGEGGGVCFAPGITAISKAGLNIMVPLLLLGWTMLFGLVAYSRHRFRRGARASHRWQEGFIQGLLSSTTLGYSTLLKVTLSLLQCVPVETLGQRLLINGGIECYTTWQQALFAVVVGLSMFPVGLWLWLRKQLTAPDFVGSKAEDLTAPFAFNRRVWPAVVFAERFVLVLIGAMSSEERRPWVMCFVLIILIGIYIVAAPYKESSLNTGNTVLRVTLLALCILSTASTMYRVEQVSDSERKIIPFAIAGAILKILPLVTLLCGLCIFQLSIRCSKQAPTDGVDLELSSIASETMFEPPLSDDFLQSLGTLHDGESLICLV